MSEPLKPIDMLMGLAVAVTWGMGLVFAKAAIVHFPPILLMSLRFTVTALALVWFVRPPINQLWPLFKVTLVAATIQYSLTFTGLKGLDAGVTALIVQLEVPILTLLGAVLLHEKTGLRKWMGIALAFVGVAMIVGAPTERIAFASAALVIGGSFTWAVGQVMVRQLKDIDGLTITAWVAVLAAPQLFVMSLLFESGQWLAAKSAPPVVWISVAYLGLIMTAFGYWLWYTLVRRHPVSQVAPYLLLLPLVSVIGGILFLGETLSWSSLIGGAVVLAGVASIVLEKRQT
ncbi:MAG: EamA family transporter [Paracoccaceae bacterium]|nr:EamA family transporter [Paracoccaceae bacterium]MDG1739652.1 EamA family transporter [Paracoccaceae bacterium]MDG2257193.1 EamA family transporter [Paracoccaceae bacterium]